ncbi:putative vomeronasal receptor-like protein 4 [Ursus maritimus]|uniref:Vomeronasal type-1 receptor n=1 Tax=Ursus maritimus TaxID=29073 RepID=A0A384C929_URSMA|nr:putative vomeronasal receptor-like protein 4 [Ursus maritimus]XP_026366914.1 putative vomeronasal receptor-like protein 4 [Ursus arctos]
MVSSNIKGPMFLFLSLPGIVGNIFVFVNYMCVFFWDTKKKSLHLILIHLAFTNMILLFSKVTLKTIERFGLKNFPDDADCKTFVYLERVARGLSICTSSLLTVVQATTISPRASVRASFKPASTCCTLSFFLFLWILNSLLSMNLLYYMKNVSSLNSSQFGQSDRYCYFLPVGQTVRWMFLILMALRDFLFLGLMGWTSVYMVLILHKHHKHARYLQKPKVLYHIPPEIRAAHSVLLLMLCFLFFYWADCIISLCVNSSLDSTSFVLMIREFLAVGYAILSPFMLMHRDRHVAECFAHLRKLGKYLFCH